MTHATSLLLKARRAARELELVFAKDAPRVGELDFSKGARAARRARFPLPYFTPEKLNVKTKRVD